MAEPIYESGMDFISDNTFNIEKTSRYSDFGKGTRSVDSVRIKDNNLLFVEAKTTFTNPNNPDIDNINRFSKSIYEMIVNAPVQCNNQIEYFAHTFLACS